MDDVDFGPVICVIGGADLRAAGVDVLADPHAAEAVAALHADPTIGDGIDKIADRADDFALVVIDAHAVMVNDLRGPRFAIRASRAQRTASRGPRAANHNFSTSSPRTNAAYSPSR